MTARYLVDTDWAIDYLGGRPQVIARLRTCRQEGLAMSVITLAELLDGAYSSRNPEEEEAGIHDLLEGLELLLVEEMTGRLFAEQRSKLRREGKTIGDFDLLIASTALQHDLTLLSNNRRHFDMIAGLRLESV